VVTTAVAASISRHNEFFPFGEIVRKLNLVSVASIYLFTFGLQQNTP
jgi:hypothetical protein